VRAASGSARLAQLGDAAGAIAFVFPGQGSQHPGMVRTLHRCSPSTRTLVDRAERATGVALTELMTSGDADALADPRIAQLAVFVTSTALLEELRLRGWRPAVVAGHSLGEYSALAAAGVVDWDDALRLVDARGTAMAAAAATRPGAMAAVAGLDITRLEGLCRLASHYGEHVSIANINSGSQLVISGSEIAVTRVIDAARVAGALRACRLPVGGAYHSPLMQPAADLLRGELREIDMRRPMIPFVSSATGDLVDDPEEHRKVLMEQVLLPVEWKRTVERLVALGVEHVAEVGPGHVLTGLCRDNARAVNRVHAEDLLTLPTLVPTLTAVGDRV